MNVVAIPAALLVTFLIVLLLALASGRPLSGLWIVIIIVFLATLSGQLWITPFGPATWGVSWVPLLIVALFVALLFFALLPPAPGPEAEAGAAVASVALGAFFWVMMVILLVSIFIGFYRTA